MKQRTTDRTDRDDDDVPRRNDFGCQELRRSDHRLRLLALTDLSGNTEIGYECTCECVGEQRTSNDATQSARERERANLI